MVNMQVSAYKGQPADKMARPFLWQIKGIALGRGRKKKLEVINLF